MAKKLRVRKRTALSIRTFRAAISNGSSLFVDKSLDQRSTFCRRLRDLIASHVSDLGGHGNVSEAEARLIHRAAMLTLQLELMEQQWAAADGAASRQSLELYQRAANSLRRLLESLGLRRRARDVTPSLGQILREGQRDL